MAKKTLIAKGQPAGGSKRRAVRRRAKSAPPASGLQSPACALRFAPIRRVRLGELHPAAYNPRRTLQPEDRRWQRLAASLTEFGLVDPLIWNSRTGNLVGGHQRLRILREVHGLSDADAIEVAVVDLDEPRERELNLVLNNEQVAGQWDADALRTVLADLRDNHQRVGNVGGFDAAEIAALLTDRAGRRKEVSFLATEDEEGPAEDVEYKVVVDCRDQKHQAQLLTRLTAEGLTARAMTM